MNQVERLIEIKLAQRTIDGLDRQLFHLKRAERKHVEMILDKNTDPDVRAVAQIELSNLTPRIAAVEDQRFQLKLLIDEKDAEAAQQASIRVISETRDRAQIVIAFEQDNGKKMSYTRHVRRDGTAYVGFSTLTSNKVTYRLPGTANEEAA